MDDIIISFFGMDNQISRGFVFGIVHVSIMLLGYYSGFSINRLLKILSNGYIAGIIGASLAHVIADLVAAMMYMLFIITLQLLKITFLFLNHFH